MYNLSVLIWLFIFIFSIRASDECANEILLFPSKDNPSPSERNTLTVCSGSSSFSDIVKDTRYNWKIPYRFKTENSQTINSGASLKLTGQDLQFTGPFSCEMSGKNSRGDSITKTFYHYLLPLKQASFGMISYKKMPLKMCTEWDAIRFQRQVPKVCKSIKDTGIDYEQCTKSLSLTCYIDAQGNSAFLNITLSTTLDQERTSQFAEDNCAVDCLRQFLRIQMVLRNVEMELSKNIEKGIKQQDPSRQILEPDARMLVGNSEKHTIECEPGYVKYIDPLLSIQDRNNIKTAYCTPCPRGSYQSGDKCLWCEPGTYQSETGQTSCAKCPAGSPRRAYGSYNIGDCRIEPADDSQRNRNELACFFAHMEMIPPGAVTFRAPSTPIRNRVRESEDAKIAEEKLRKNSQQPLRNLLLERQKDEKELQHLVKDFESFKVASQDRIPYESDPRNNDRILEVAKGKFEQIKEKRNEIKGVENKIQNELQSFANVAGKLNEVNGEINALKHQENSEDNRFERLPKTGEFKSGSEGKQDVGDGSPQVDIEKRYGGKEMNPVRLDNRENKADVRGREDSERDGELNEDENTYDNYDDDDDGQGDSNDGDGHTNGDDRLYKRDLYNGPQDQHDFGAGALRAIESSMAAQSAQDDKQFAKVDQEFIDLYNNIGAINNGMANRKIDPRANQLLNSMDQPAFGPDFRNDDMESDYPRSNDLNDDRQRRNFGQSNGKFDRNFGPPRDEDFDQAPGMEDDDYSQNFDYD